MTDVITTGELVADFQQFFAPASTDMIDGLISEHAQIARRIHAMAAVVNDPAYSWAMHHFIEGNCRDERYGIPRKIEKLFEVDGAIAHLHAHYWDKALKLTDVLDAMPQARRTEWYEQIQACKTPAFEEGSVRSTLGHLLQSRSKFFAERVDGIFRALSRTHVTNQPEGFGKRMIIPNVIDSFGHANWDKCGYINDLRCVIARFMGREEPAHYATRPVVDAVRRHNGQWAYIDGGALRMRIYNGVGTAHLEVHPDMAWRLNAILASLYPAAIPSRFRQRPTGKAKNKDFGLIQRPLPFSVIALLGSMKEASEINGADPRGNSTMVRIRNSLAESTDNAGTPSHKEAQAVLEAIGGVLVQREIGRHGAYWQFDYDPTEVIGEIVCSGCIPDQKSHQFYPTPERLALIAIEAAEIEDHHYCLEPSAGMGGIAKFMPNKDRTFCVEISSVHAKSLIAQGFQVHQADFLYWANAATRFDRVVMNPPFSEGRWRMHLEAAANLVADGGKMVAILPASAKGTDLPGFNAKWLGPFDNEFAGTSVSVVMLVAARAGA